MERLLPVDGSCIFSLFHSKSSRHPVDPALILCDAVFGASLWSINVGRPHLGLFELDVSSSSTVIYISGEGRKGEVSYLVVPLGPEYDVLQ